MQPKADFTAHLTILPAKNGGIDTTDRVIKGTEHMLRYPHHTPHPNSARGILTFGTKKINGTSYISISNQDASRLPEGWRVFHRATHYSYVLPPTTVTKLEIAAYMERYNEKACDYAVAFWKDSDQTEISVYGEDDELIDHFTPQEFKDWMDKRDPCQSS